MLAQKGGFDWADVRKIDVKDRLKIHLTSGVIKSIALEELETIRRYACQYCLDYSAEFADIAFGGIGADEGWTTVVTRTPLGRAALADAKTSDVLESVPYEDNPTCIRTAQDAVLTWSRQKRKSASEARRALGSKSIRVGI